MTSPANEVAAQTEFEYGPYLVTTSEAGEKLTIYLSPESVQRGLLLTFGIVGIALFVEGSTFVLLPRLRLLLALPLVVLMGWHIAQMAVAASRAKTTWTVDRAKGELRRNTVLESPLKEIAVVRWVSVFDALGRGQTWAVALEKGGSSRYAHGTRFLVLPLWDTPYEEEVKDFAKNLALYLGVAAAKAK